MGRRLFLAACVLLLGCYVSADDDIHSMIVGDRTLELVENRQITYRADGKVCGVWISPNGASVVCQFESDAEKDLGSLGPKLSVVRSSDGRAVPLKIGLQGQSDELVPMMNDLFIAGSLAWSPDSRLIAFPARHIKYEPSNGGKTPNPLEETSCIAVMNSSGSRQTVFSLSGTGELASALVWSPDSKKIACALIALAEDGTSEDSVRLCILDLSDGSMKIVRSETGRVLVPLDWQSDGKALSFAQRAVKSPEWQVLEISLNDRSVRTIGDYADPHDMSPNGAYRLLNSGGKGIRLEDRSSGKAIDLAASPEVYPCGWSSDSRMLLYYRLETIKGEKGVSDQVIKMLWAASVEGTRRNHMCVALDIELRDDGPSWSADCLKLAYASRGRAYVAEMAWTDLDAEGKLKAGLPLTEEEEKEIITRNASQLAKDILVCASDNNDTFPSADAFRKNIGPYVVDPSIMLRPGTDQYIVQYFPQPPIDQIESTSDTMLAILDAGYGWQVVAYVDGHVKVVQKQ